ncbi:hypothetical protein PITCH_A720006 [uncultured Desulfobacterium sp.]|uniref:Uncharacterized protein n=1 Tax=uncultured Desulfobacterium sp. TaxID=201089 RepID=A0A445N1U1_9BACT|nr:hypothetical protein PITCH_A720006 [uncultured Desulfobacterium sp.]
MEPTSKIIKVNVENGDMFCTYGRKDEVGPCGTLPGYGKSHVPSIRADELASRLGVNDDDGLAEARRVKEQYKQSRAGVNVSPGASQGSHGADSEYQTALKAKQQYQQSREVEENERVSDFAFLANGGKVSDLMASKGTYAELHILNKTGEAQRLRKLAKQEALSPEDEAWIQSMFALAGQREG